MAREATAAPGGVRALRNHDDIVVWSDEQLLSQFLSRSGESAEAAFTTLIERHGPLVHRVCLDILRGRDEAQDAAQAVFLVLARKAGSIRKPESLGPWLHGVALRVARHARSEMARRRVAERRNAEMSRQAPGDRIGTRNHGLHRAARGNRSATRKIPTAHHTLLHAGTDPFPGRGGARLAHGDRPGPPASRPGTIAIQADTPRVRPDRSDHDRPRDIAGREDRLPGREWTETTARAAIRFASGQGTSGLVAPVVIGWAESVLTAKVKTMLKIVALMTIVLLLGWVGFSAIGPSNDGGVSKPGAERTMRQSHRTGADATSGLARNRDAQG